MAAAGALDVVWLLGADEIDVAPGAFVVYQGTQWGTAARHRADVTLPGGGLHREERHLREHLRDVRNWASAPRSRRATPARTGRYLRAVSDVLGARLPFDTLAQLRQGLHAAHPHLSPRARGADHGPADPAAIAALAAHGGAVDKAPFASPINGFYLTNPIARASAIMAECLGARTGRPAGSGRVRTEQASMTFWEATLDIGLIALASLTLMSGLMIYIAYVLYAEPQDLGGGAAAPRAERGRPLGPAAVLRGLPSSSCSRSR